VPNSKGNSMSIAELQRYLAHKVLLLQIGDPLPSVREIAAQTRTSIGSVSIALRNLEDNGAVIIDRRGRLGSFIESRSVVDLWNTIEPDPLVIAFTLPGNLRFEGLATALKTLFNNQGVDTYLIFIRGSKTRLKALQEKRCHIALVSSFTAEMDRRPGLKVILTLPAGTWLKEQKVFYRRADLNEPYRVALDPESFDHTRLTELEFSSNNVIYQQITFSQVARLMIEGQVDATIWNSEDIRFNLAPTITSRPLSEKVIKVVKDRDLSAALVVRQQDSALQALIKEVILVPELVQIQNRIIAGEAMPAY